MDDEPWPPQRELRAGRDYPIWPNLKLAHASRLASQLEYDYQLWRIGLGDETRAEFSEDRCEVTFFASIRNAPPTYEWSLSLGDVIHNFRSALDALAWAVANLDGNHPSPRNEKRIYFPLAHTPEAFQKLSRDALASVPAFVLERLESVQPYYGGAPELALGVLLNDMNILDKHRSSLELHPAALDGYSYSIRYRYEDVCQESDLDAETYQWVADAAPLHDGQQILHVTFARAVAEAEISDLPMSLQIELGGTRHDAFELLTLIHRQVSLIFRRVNLGFLPDDDQYLAADADSHE